MVGQTLTQKPHLISGLAIHMVFTVNSPDIIDGLPENTQDSEDLFVDAAVLPLETTQENKASAIGTDWNTTIVVCKRPEKCRKNNSEK